MDTISYVSNAPMVQVPTITADTRATADVSAVLRDPQPDIPMPFPASLGQQAEVIQSRLSASATLGQIEEVERVLKPYNVTMLPHDPGENDKDADFADEDDTDVIAKADPEEIGVGTDDEAVETAEKAQQAAPDDSATEKLA